MKKGIINILLVASILITPSCTATYFYSTLNVEEPNVEKVDNGDFFFENDSVWIAHSFKGEDAPILISVYNKLDVPMYVDWSKSALILDGIAYPYATSKAHQSGVGESVTYGDITAYTQTIYNGTIDLPKHIDFIPPKTRVVHQGLRLAAKFDEISDSKYQKAKMQSESLQMIDVKYINFEHHNTPLRFGSYITVYNTPQKAQAYRSNFYVTRLIKTKTQPDKLPNDMANRGDMFYQCVGPDNTGWYVLGTVGVVVGATAVDILIHKDDDYYYHH